MLAAGILKQISPIGDERSSRPQRKRIARAIFFIGVIAIAAGEMACSGPYLRNRWNDTADVFTATVETQSYGGAVRLGPLKGGLNYKSETGGAAGLRGGESGAHHSADFTIFFFGADYFSDETIRFDDWKPKTADATDADAADAEEDAEDADSETDVTDDSKAARENVASNENADAALATTNAEPDQRLLRLRDKLFHALSPFGTEKPAHKSRSLLKGDDTDWAPAYYFTQAEIQLGLYVGLRLGWNVGETFDFLAGWFGFDPLDDDAPYTDSVEEQLEQYPYWNLLDEEAKENIRKRLREGGGLPVSPF